MPANNVLLIANPESTINSNTAIFINCTYQDASSPTTIRKQQQQESSSDLGESLVDFAAALTDLLDF